MNGEDAAVEAAAADLCELSSEAGRYGRLSDDGKRAWRAIVIRTGWDKGFAAMPEATYTEATGWTKEEDR